MPIACIGRCFGELLQALKDAELENTIVVFTSDHGDMLGSSQSAADAQQQDTYEASARDHCSYGIRWLCAQHEIGRKHVAIDRNVNTLWCSRVRHPSMPANIRKAIVQAVQWHSIRPGMRARQSWPSGTFGPQLNLSANNISDI